MSLVFFASTVEESSLWADNDCAPDGNQMVFNLHNNRPIM